MTEYYEASEERLQRRFEQSTASIANLGYVLEKRVLADHGAQSQKVHISNPSNGGHRGKVAEMERVRPQTIEIIE
jgi:hypothetical protein